MAVPTDPNWAKSPAGVVQKTAHGSYLKPRKLFKLSGILQQFITSEDDSIFVHRRLRYYLNHGRRGKLKLPCRFHNLQILLARFSKTEIRQLMYAVKPDTSLEHPLSKRMFEYVNQILPGHIWNPYGLRRAAGEVDKFRLPLEQWPRNPRPCWPSTPTFTEMLTMARRGIATTGLQKRTDRAKCPISRDDMDRIRVARWVVSNNVIGIRSHLVPQKFLQWFRCRSGFSILTVRHSLPAGLVRFLLSVWKTNPYSLWLKENCRLKSYLRSTSLPSKLILEEAFSSYEGSSYDDGEGYGSPDSDSEAEFRLLLERRISLIQETHKCQ